MPTPLTVEEVVLAHAWVERAPEPLAETMLLGSWPNTEDPAGPSDPITLWFGVSPREGLTDPGRGNPPNPGREHHGSSEAEEQRGGTRGGWRA